MPDTLISKQRDVGLDVGGALASFIFILGVVAFIGSLFGAGGMYLYGRILTSRTEAKKAEVSKLEEELHPDLIDQIIALDKKLSSLATVLKEHVISSNTFKLLEENTLPQVRFTSYNLAVDPRKMDLNGEATSYTVLAQQVRFLESLQRSIERVDFGGLSINDAGIVTFKMGITFKSPLVRYQGS